jgi:DNA-binding PadR family transcriptional regulator
MSPEPKALSFLPLTPAVFHLLLALVDGPLHGYAIAKAVSEHTGGQTELGPGTLYGTLTRMEESGLVRERVEAARSSEAARRKDENSRRRVYEITALGRSVARAETRRLSELLAVARGKALLSPKGR